MLTIYTLLTIAVTVVGFFLGRKNGTAFYTSALRRTDVHSLPVYHGLFTASVTLVPMLLAVVVWMNVAPAYTRSAAFSAVPATSAAVDPARQKLEEQSLLRDIQLTATQLDQGRPLVRPEMKAAGEAYNSAQIFAGFSLVILGIAAGLGGMLFGLRSLTSVFRARNIFEQIVMVLLIGCCGVAILTTVGIVFSVVYETINFASKYSFISFLTGTVWSPSSLTLGALPLFAGTILITLIAISVAAPIGLFAAIYMSEYASQRFRDLAKPILEVLAGIPTVVFGFFAALTIAPMFKGAGDWIDLTLGTNLGVASESALAAGLVMGVMIIPFVSSLSDDVINAVPQSLRDGSYAMGATKSETIKKVVLTAALPGIVSAIMLAISRAVGETMIVVMAAGLAGNLTWNPLEAVTTITVQIKTLLVGDQEFDSAKTLSAFALGFVLFMFTLALNVIALRIVRKYREQYD
jgi:phosphate transport system permease protein